jgi:hypothetical protein
MPFFKNPLSCDYFSSCDLRVEAGAAGAEAAARGRSSLSFGVLTLFDGPMWEGELLEISRSNKEQYVAKHNYTLISGAEKFIDRSRPPVRNGPCASLKACVRPFLSLIIRV